MKRALIAAVVLLAGVAGAVIGWCVCAEMADDNLYGSGAREVGSDG